MRRADVEIGSYYIAKVSGHKTVIRIDKQSPPRWCDGGHGGWEVKNMSTGRRIHIKSAARLRFKVVCTKDGLWIRAADVVC